MTKAAGRVRIGIAGWVFEPWRGVFYPPGLPRTRELAHAAGRLGLIEINATFRANQKPASFLKWAAETPPDFVFSVKGPQAVTHIRRLKNCEEALAGFFASGVLGLGPRLGPIVWQLPPNLRFDAEVMDAFLALLPRSAGPDTPIRHAIEGRHESFADPTAADLLAAHDVALVIPDTARMPGRALTARFVYCRLQGPARPDAEGYSDADLDGWADQIRAWAADGRDVFAVFVHEDKLHAPTNAMALMARLGLGPDGAQ